ncbi:undecaprenyldiphospho-muramoylpentapeptide beta-N-acetylglucosaminyltransferase [Pseudobdellovibrio sp. HCB154]|uniref:undecaprenyldiphospho-muramoylpentapeptide beta-N-acetylglucosaminyltransferase n=1 Tax=Pseudobdellovibrio sp. HCB154 TaxID=3386277 RepID=UPI00391766F9
MSAKRNAQQNKIIIAGGGTGGHIYPAISIAEAILKKDAQADILFVGTPQGMESRIVPKAGYKLQLIQSGKLNMKGQIFAKLKTLVKIPFGILQSFWIILTHKPQFVLGVGGYASAPMLLAALLCGRKTALWEGNAHPGMANRLLSKFISKAYLVFGDAKDGMASTQVNVWGMPLRSEIERICEGAQNKEHKVFTIVCTGGSQGSMFLNDQLSDLILKNPEWHSKIKVYHQTGTLDFQRIKNKYGNTSCVEVMDYIYDMPRYYQEADMHFCRGGAGSLSETAAFGVVPVVVPLPAADNHQQHNAEALVRADAGFMLLQKTFDPAQFKKIVLDLMSNPDLKNKMSKNLKQLAPLKASQKIASDILESIQQ